MLGISPLRHSQIDRAFPLMQMALPQLSLPAWRRFAAHECTMATPFAARGIMVGSAPNGMLRSAFVYAVEYRQRPRGAGWQWCLVVRHLVSPVLGRELAMGNLLRAIRRLARAHFCDDVTIELPADAAWETGIFKMNGFEVQPADAPERLPWVDG